MDLETLKAIIKELPHDKQDHLAGFLLMERLKRNKLIMPALHARIDDSNPENWQSWEKTQSEL